ncbi:CbtA family protein [Amycolatopsis sp. cg5]|uniref:CbtA family protein n=1 Tax=Amycolatopsis sp. cg5 TaxID=3238802 RepID=UPI003524198C
MMRTLLVRGMLAGLIAGVLATLFAYFFGEPSINAAIGIEEAGAAAHSHTHDPAPPAAHDHGAAAEPEEELVSRDVQSTLGLLVAVGVYGTAIGGLFSLAFAFVYGRVGKLRPRLTAAALGAFAFAVVFFVPFLKYPGNPPAVGKAETIGERTGLYFGFVALSLIVAVLAVVLRGRLTAKFGAWTAGLLGIGGYVVVMAVCAWLMPIIDEVGGDFPASTLWTFRVSSIGTQLVLWTVLGLTFGALAERVFAKKAVAVA